MKKIILLILLTSCLSLFSGEINVLVKFGDSETLINTINYEAGVELRTDNFYIETVKGYKDSLDYWNYEISARHTYRFKKKVWSEDVLDFKRWAERDTSGTAVYELICRDNPPKIIETPFGIQVGAKVIKIDLKNIGFTEINLKALYEYKNSRTKFFLFKYALQGNYLIGVAHQWKDSKTSPSTKMVIERTLKHKLWHIMSMDYSISYLSSDLKTFDNEIQIRLSADVYIFNVFFRYSQKNYERSTMTGQFGIGYKF